MAPANVRISPLGMVLIAAGIIALIFYAMRGSSQTKVHRVVDPNSPTVSMQAILSAAIDLAQKGGVKVKEVRENAANIEEEVKGLTVEGAKELKTNGDMQSHIQIVHGFKKGFPKLNIVSEEKEKKPSSEHVPYPNLDLSFSLTPSADEQVKWDDIVVWVDPLDATQEYSEKLIQYVTTMVCVVVKGKPVMGVIHNPFLKSTSWAWVSHGHSDDLKMLPETEIKKPRIIISRSHAGDMNETGRKAFPEGLDLTPAGGAGYKVLSLFRGVADAYVHVTKIKKWDICAGNAILNALGGKMTTLKGEEIEYSSSTDPAVNNGLLATMHYHDEFLKKLSPVYEELVQKHKHK